MTEDRKTLTVEMAQRMYMATRDMPELTSQETRQKYEAMADEGRAAIAARLEEYSDSVVRICLEKKHVGSTPPTEGEERGTPCGSCRKQVRYMRAAIKIVAPTPGG